MAELSEAQKERNKSLGGSDAAAALGMSRWKTPLALWAEKTGQVIPPDISGRLDVRLGNRLEQVVAELFTEETGKKVKLSDEVQVHPKYPFLVGHLDRTIDGEDAIFEAKTASGWKVREWSEDEIPAEYQIQVMHYLGVTGKARGYIACLIGGNQKLVIKTIERDEAMIKSIIEREVAFWNTYVVPKVMPGNITWADGDTLAALFPDARHGDPIELGDDANRLLETLQSMNQDCGVLEGQIEKTRNELKAMLKDNAEGRTAQWVVSWKPQKDTRLDIKRIKAEEPEVYKRFSNEKQIRVLRYHSITGD